MLQALEKKQLVLFFYAVTITGMVLSPYLLSVGMISLAVLSLITFRITRSSFALDIDREAIGRMLQLVKFPPFAMLTLFFFVVLIGPLPADDYTYWLARLRIKLPFLGLPLVFLGHPPLERKALLGLLYFLLLLMLLTAVGVSLNYAMHYEEVQEMLKKGQPMPTPRNHIRYSLILAFSIIGGGYLFQQGYYLKYRWERFGLLVVTILLFLFIHLLSVRSGLLALYLALGVLCLRYIMVSRRYILGGLALVLLCSLPILAYWLVPSFQAKIAYMRWSLEKYREGAGDVYADPGRIVSWQIGWDIHREHPIFGIGYGNIRAEVERRFEQEYPGRPQALLPHNQFLFVLAASGWIGLAIFAFAYFFPLLYRHNFRHPLMLGFYAIATAAFAIEHTIENAMGVGFYVFFLLLLLTHFNRRLPVE
ncbi:MAG: hypothetical protein GVY26_00720 [Bacteroidetes bacterium]|jgi:O-antigen ligase|nr:hypothetical protein [Bacteroidota bacterium]